MIGIAALVTPRPSIAAEIGDNAAKIGDDATRIIDNAAKVIPC